MFKFLISLKKVKGLSQLFELKRVMTFSENMLIYSLIRTIIVTCLRRRNLLNLLIRFVN